MGEHLCLVGNDTMAGNWDVKKSVVMETSPELYPLWKVTVDLQTSLPFEYRYIVRYERPLYYHLLCAQDDAAAGSDIAPFFVHFALVFVVRLTAPNLSLTRSSCGCSAGKN